MQLTTGRRRAVRTPGARAIAALLVVAGSWAVLDALALPIDEQDEASRSPSRPQAPPATGPKVLPPLEVSDLVGTWNLVPPTPDLRLRLRIERRAKSGGVDCSLAIGSPDGDLDEPCAITRTGNRIRIVGRAAESSSARPPDTLVGVVERGELIGKFESRRAIDVRLVQEGSPAEAAAKVAAANAAAAAKQAEAAKQAAAAAAWLKAMTPEMVAVPAGSFSMGSPWNELGRSFGEGPQHPVNVAAFEIGKYPVTFEQWDGCVADGGCNGYLPSDQGWGRGRQPVVNVGWDDAQAYVKWLSGRTNQHFRLPSEAEWEYAARAGTTTARPWGDPIGSGNANCNGCGGPADMRRAAPVGSFKPNAFGLHDVLGNVWQLMQDCWREDYKGATADSVAWPGPPECAQRAVRGGSWIRDASFSRSAERLWVGPTDRNHTMGFRVVRTP